MRVKIAVYISVLFIISQVQSQTFDCNKFPFYPADHIRNPSLEKVGAFCWDNLGSTEVPGLSGVMELVIPHWRLPIRDYGTVLYFGECNKFDVGPGEYPLAPQPIPDGSGIIGLMTARTESGTPVADRLAPKFYISTNLIRTLKKDSLYRLDFAIGFGLPNPNYDRPDISGSPVRFTVFGLNDSTKIPFTKPATPGILGCLTVHFPEWIPLGSVVVSGEPGTWQRAVIEFIAPSSIESIAIGSACDQSDLPFTPRETIDSKDFYFIDDLKFFQASAPKPRLSQIAGGSCEGQSATLRLQSNDFYNGSAFQWYKNNSPIPETAVALTVSSSTYGPGWYKMRVQNDSVCMMTDSVHLSWSPRITDPFSGHPDTTLCMGDVLELKINSSPGTSYLWDTGSTDSSITVTRQGIYSVRISNACNTLNATKTVKYKDCPPAIFVPTAFTPNGDGLNDVFRVNAAGRMKTFSLVVYDRYGQKIFASNDPSKGWDGTIRSKKQSTGLYIWMLRYTDGSDITHNQKGILTLIR